MNSTGIDGRACFFNVEPSVVSVNVFSAGKPLAAGVTSVVPGRHREDQFSVMDNSKLELSIAAVTTSHEQLGSDGQLSNSFRQVEFINLSLAGESEFFAASESGKLQYDGDVNLLNDRALVFGQDGDFELTAYQLDRGDWNNGGVIPLVPRGFVEDMAVYADVPFDPSLGSILAYQFGVPSNVEIRFKLVSLEDENRQMDGWIYSQGSTAKAMFFNLEPGAYALLVESSQGHWLNYQEVFVYSETLSFIGNRGAVSGLTPLSR
jgi:hypothetical protein